MDVAGFKEQSRSMWAAGDYDAVAELIWSVGERLVERLGVREGEAVLDVACGTGNAALPAAEAGARVTGLDLTPELLERARQRAEGAGVEIDWAEGDAEDLPFEDESFDVVLSTFGCMFAPRHALVARELARVLRPGGRIGIASWTPEGFVGEFFRTIAAQLPPPPPFAEPPLLWGTPEHVKSLFAGTGLDLEFARDAVDFRFESAPEAARYYEAKFGPVIAARALLEPEGRWEATHEELVALYARHAASDGTIAVAAEYLVAFGRKPAAA
ncbi:MAG TPA: class I SAM-dependent methyltransferase [Gaiellaceae bacterium]|nr:class I SAM-dependent methyltransferase [Gaiellaceae bacterium]